MLGGIAGQDKSELDDRRRCLHSLCRLGQRKHFPPHRRLLFNVAAAMPRLEMELQGLPMGMYVGEVAACTAVIVNRGTLPLRNLQLVLSCPEVGLVIAYPQTLLLLRSDDDVSPPG